MYEEKGYINFSYVPEQNFNQSEKTVELLFTLEEGIPFYVDRISFAGSTLALDSRLRAAVTPFLEEGRIFRPADLDAAIAAINKLQAFKKIDLGDCTVGLKENTSGPQMGRVQITCNLNPPPTP